jgi:hypothetical protein
VQCSRELIAGRLHASQQFIELQMQGTRIAVCAIMEVTIVIQSD